MPCWRQEPLPEDAATTVNGREMFLYYEEHEGQGGWWIRSTMIDKGVDTAFAWMPCDPDTLEPVSGKMSIPFNSSIHKTTGVMVLPLHQWIAEKKELVAHDQQKSAGGGWLNNFKAIAKAHWAGNHSEVQRLVKHYADLPVMQQIKRAGDSKKRKGSW